MYNSYHCNISLIQMNYVLVNTWVEEQKYTEMSLEELAKIRHEEMEPSNPDYENGGHRRQKRKDFCESVAERAYDIACGLAKDRSWRHHFNDETDSTVRTAIEGSDQLQALLKIVEGLMDNLSKCRDRNMADPSLVMVFDEASSLFYA